jgi:hypothetical protein
MIRNPVNGRDSIDMEKPEWLDAPEVLSLRVRKLA